MQRKLLTNGNAFKRTEEIKRWSQMNQGKSYRTVCRPVGTQYLTDYRAVLCEERHGKTQRDY